MYTDDKNAQVVLALLKKFGIKKIVISPGMTNVPISRSVQIDPWFEAYSVVDERSAAYFACGLAEESGEPVVISCTGATASRNYLPGLTEAYYRHLPVIALTSQRHTSDFGNLVPQITDRTVSQNDVKKISVHLPVVKDEEDFERCMLSVNKALIAATTRGGGPVHINLPVDKFSFTTKDLPDARRIEYINSENFKDHIESLAADLNNKKIAVFIGSHRVFDKNTEKALEDFVIKSNAAVIVDQTSNYKGKNSILLAQIADLRESSNLPDLIIDMGSITGEYSIGWLGGIETWRISEDGEIHDRFHRQTKLFDCSEEFLFSTLKEVPFTRGYDYYTELAQEVGNIVVPDMPLSNTLISKELSRRLPKHSNLHMGILNSLRNMNLFSLDKTINTSSNVGGFGIDGPLSTLVGQSMVDKNRLNFGLVGDLAAFYDMNALGIRHLGKNVRILVVNNNGGAEFRLNASLEEQLGEATNEFISAYGHNGSIQAWAESVGLYYMSARNKKELVQNMDDFCTADINKFGQPVLFEVFTSFIDEQRGLELLRKANRPDKKVNGVKFSESSEISSLKIGLKDRLKKMTPESAKKLYRDFRKK